MKIGDLVIVKDVLGYNTYMQNLAGHIGVIVKERYNEHWVKVHILGKTKRISIYDLEVVK
jgi:dTDP-4-dehydrorhamnose reductase